MKKSLILLCGSLLLASGTLVATEVPKQVDKSYARSLFMSTAGSTVQYEEKNEEKKVVSKKVATSKKTTQVSKKDSFASGMQIQILRLTKDNSLKPVNPYSYAFREGEKFKVRVSVNLPGVIMFNNVDPQGKEAFLGAWPIERAFSAVEIPYEGFFEFYGAKGEDKLYIIFKPCRVEKDLVSNFESRTSYSRSIRVVSSDLEEKVQLKNEVTSSLPACTTDLNYYSEENIKPKRSQFTSYSRSIRFVSDEEGSLYAFSSANSQKNMPSRGSGNDFVVSVLTLKFR